MQFPWICIFPLFEMRGSCDWCPCSVISLVCVHHIRQKEQLKIVQYWGFTVIWISFAKILAVASDLCTVRLKALSLHWYVVLGPNLCLHLVGMFLLYHHSHPLSVSGVVLSVLLSPSLNLLSDFINKPIISSSINPCTLLDQLVDFIFNIPFDGQCQMTYGAQYSHF